MFVKTIIRHYLILLLAALLAVTLISACTGMARYDVDGNVILETPPGPTDELVVYWPPCMTGSFYSEFLKMAETIYIKSFPDVKLTIRTFGDYDDEEAYEEYIDLLQAELSAGKGPDLVIFTRKDFPDLHKVLKSNVFYNIDNFLSDDESFDKLLYNEAVFNGGCYEEQRLFIPLDYNGYLIVTTDEAMGTYGVSWTEQMNFREWSDTVISYMNTHTFEEIRILLQSVSNDCFINNCIPSFINYETGKVSVNTNVFRQYMDFYKAIYPLLSVDSAPLTINVAHDIREARIMSSVDDAYINASIYLAELRKTDSVRLFPLPAAEGHELYVTGYRRIAICNSSPNKANAYEFLKILLSLPWSTDFYTVPVNNVSLLAGLETIQKNIDLTEDEIIYFYNQLQKAEYREWYANDVIDIINTTMLPWVNDEKTYEDCLAELQSTLELYLYE